MKSLTQHVVPVGRGWAVRTANKKDYFIITTTQSQALSIATKLAKSSAGELVVHAKDGSIKDRKSFAVTRTSKLK